MSYNGLTNQGLEYLTRCQVESKPVVFSKVKIGNGNIPMGSTGETTTDLYSFKKEIEILNKEQVENSIKMEILINNFDVLEEFYVKEIGVYVMDNDVEKLYWYINKDRPSPLPDKNTPAKHRYILHLETSQMESIILNYTGADLLVDKEFVEEKLNEVKDRTKALQFSDIESMKQKNLKVGDIVEVLGYYTAGDGAGHKRIIANEDDGSGVQLANKLWANIVEKNIVYTSWFGTKENEDSTEAVQKALDVLPNTKSTIIVDKPTTVSIINVKSHKTLTGNKLKVEQLIMHYSSNLINIELEPNNSLDNKPMILIDRDILNARLGSVEQKADIVINNVIVHGKYNNDNQNRDFLVIKNDNNGTEVNKGLWGITVSNLKGSVPFKTIIKLKNGTSKNASTSSWTTYCIFNNIHWWDYINAIELLTYNIEEGEYSASTRGSIQNITFDNCTFESTSDSKTFCRFGNNSRNIRINNSYSGDFPEKNNKTYYIFDNRENSRSTNLKLYFPTKQFVDEWIFTTLGNGLYYLRDGKDIAYHYWLKTSFDDNIGNDFWYNRFTYEYTYIIVAKIPKDSDILDFFSINYMLSTESIKNSKYSIPFINFNCKDSSAGNTSNISGETNISLLNNFCIFKDSDENRYIAIKITKSNYFPFNNGHITPIYNEKYYYHKMYRAEEPADLIFVEEINFTKEPQVQQLNTLYHLEKMKQENVYDDYITYNDEKFAYDKQQKEIEKQKQLAYEQALKENPNLSYEEFLSIQLTNFNLIEEPQPSEALKKFMEKYL